MIGGFFGGPLDGDNNPLPQRMDDSTPALASTKFFLSFISSLP